jgi:hypothetical protein
VGVPRVEVSMDEVALDTAVGMLDRWKKIKAAR